MFESKLPFGWSDLEDGAAERYTTKHKDSLVRDGQVRCCVRDCKNWLSRRKRGIAPEFCPDHGISMSVSPTYVYRNPLDNFIIARDLVNSVDKVERWRLGNERSEDALSWNVFVSLARLGILGAAIPELGSGTENVELYLWGNRIDDGKPRLWDKLDRVRKTLEPGAAFPTESDIMLRVPGHALVLIEAKFGSPNATLAGKEDRFESVEDFLARYPAPEGAADPLARDWIEQQQLGTVLEQLCRNVVYATWLAEPREQPTVINLVRGEAEPDVETRLRPHLAKNGRGIFRRLSWESFHPVFAARGSEARPVVDYLENKTMNLSRTFRL